MVWRVAERPGRGGRQLTPSDGDAVGPPLVVGARRRGLPGGRAVVGGFLVAAAAVVVFSATLAGRSHSGRPWVIATRPLSAGTVLGPDDLATVNLRLPAGTAAMAYPQITSLEGQSLAVAVQPGELVQRSMVTAAGGRASWRPVSVAVDPVSLTGLIPGEPVDVLAAAGGGASAGGGGAAGGVSVVVRGAVLLDVARQTGSLVAPAGTSDVTIGVTTLAEVESVVAAEHTGTITLVAAEPSDGVGPGGGG